MYARYSQTLAARRVHAWAQHLVAAVARAASIHKPWLTAPSEFEPRCADPHPIATDWGSIFFTAVQRATLEKVRALPSTLERVPACVRGPSGIPPC